jgi:NDP-sugar pyrophosphorylase family protein
MTMQKEKIAISIDKGILGNVDSKVDGSILRSRSQAIEYFLRKGLSDDSINTAVLLMKGSEQEISLKQFKGKTLIKNQIDFFSGFGIMKIYLVTQNPRKELREELRDCNVEIIETDARGNASALVALKAKIKSNFLVMSADTYNRFDLQKMINKHQNLNKLATMGLMTREKAKEYGTAILDGDLIIDFREKTSEISSHIVNAGIYIFKPEIFEMIQGISLEKDLFPRLAKIKELVGFFTYGEYEHFG